MSETQGWFGEHEALWTDPKPTTAEGLHLWRLFMHGKLGTSPAGIRDFGQRICQIEAEAAALARSESPSPEGLTEAILAWFDEKPTGYQWSTGERLLAEIAYRLSDERAARLRSSADSGTEGT